MIYAETRQARSKFAKIGRNPTAGSVYMIVADQNRADAQRIRSERFARTQRPNLQIPEAMPEVFAGVM